MKKTALLAVALATCLGYVPAQAAEVVSSNIVGYQKMTLPTQFTLVGTQFLNVGGSVKDLQEIVSDSTMPGLGYDESAGLYSFQTELRMWNGTGYDTFGWDPDGDPSVEGSDHKWVDDYLAVVENVTIPTGTAVWIKIPPESLNATLTISGEVATNSTMTTEVNAGFNLLSNPFPVATNIQDIQPDANLPGLAYDETSGLYSFQTEMRVWNGTGYDTYGWDPDGDPTIEGSDHKWVDDYLAVVDLTIPIGHGFWIKTPASGAISFKK